MKISIPKTVVILIIFLCTVLPVILALYFSALQSLKATQDILTTYAKDVLYRSNKTASQIQQGIDKLLATAHENPCSISQIDSMRDIDLSSSNIQAIGYILQDKLKCSSISMTDFQWNLGPIDLITASGVALRFNVNLPNTTTTFIGVEKQHYVAIIHKSLLIETALFDTTVSLALFSLDELKIGTFRGNINPQWIKQLGKKQALTFLQDGFAVSILKSNEFLIGAIAATPFSYLNKTTYSLAMILVPVAGLAGLLLSFLIIRWIRIQLSMTTLIRNGIKSKEFFLLYQPVFDLKTQQCVGAEALMRWGKKSGESISPDIFIPLAEKKGLIKILTEFAIDSIEKDFSGIFEKHPNFHIALNLSAEDLSSEKIIKRLNSLIEKTKARPGNLIIEITERKLLEIKIVNQILKRLRQDGIKVAIDDFGTGYSNLASLQALEIDYLKIDKSFIDAWGTGSSTSHVILYIIKMAKDLKLQIIAEGVETKEQIEFLCEQEVEFAQGWYYEKAMTHSKLKSLLAT